MSDEEKGHSRAVIIDHQHHQYHHQHPQQSQPPPPPPQYGTFQGVANYPPPHPPQHPVIGFPQPVPPPGASEPPAYPHGYQTVPGYAVAEGRPVRERRLPCCGIGVGWFLFIIGFFLGAIPWYVGLFILLCARIDPREKPGYVACTIAAVLATIAIVLGATKGADDW
ncbi:60S ribosomal protein L18a-like protein [Ricinus communis]|uniref:60S ribosomal protein L18a, plant, putative n=1 Tax=Ricinus communis TaxID=3988 RepID=B9SVW7_RICCO|nr:60S ribosomal protein L18a-like protein [Ricinus communis]EEF32252.1 60S ribosomal protein L18a, plant, putative [Ricinus communis]|eukprot:XP_002530136.1 60S ribosomal protein L18a-like protein [Ricinus communis]